MVEEFIKSNYQLLFWLVVLVIVIGLIFWFIRRTSSKVKSKKEISKNLVSERKEMVFELVKSGEGMTEKEIAGFLDIKEEEAHSYLIELIREDKISMENDVSHIPQYKSIENDG